MYLITYTSRSLMPQDKIENEISKIIKVAQERNAKDNITGVLFHENGRFLQAIEGAEKEVKTLMADIESDKRHTDIEYLINEPVITRGFPDWHMDCFDLSNKEKFSLINLQKLTAGFQKNLLPRSDLLINYYKLLLK